MATVFASCDKVIEEAIVENPETVNNIVTLHANVGPDSKVQTDNAGVFTWQAGDVISVLNNSGAAFDFETTTAGTSVDFTGTFASGSLGSYAMYPACDKHEAAGDDVNFSLPSTLDWSANASNMPMLGKISGSSANFQAVGGVLKLVCYNIPSGAEWLQFIATNKQITGDFLIDGSEANPALVTAAKAGSNNELDIDFSANYSANKVFYIPLPTGTIDGFTVNILDDNLDELFSKTTTVNLVVGLNKLILGPALNCSPVTVLWSEDFSGYVADDVPNGKVGDVTYACTDGNSATKVYTTQISAYGISPELLIGKKQTSPAVAGGTFVISDIPTNGAESLLLKFSVNNSIKLAASTGITLSSTTITTKGDNTVTITNNGSLSKFNLTFNNDYTNNVRLDNIQVTTVPESYSAPSLTPDEDALVITVGSTEATTDFTYSNKVDDMPVVALVSEEAKAWLSAEVTGTYPDYTLTVTASGAHNGAADRTGTVTLQASGVKKAIAVTQKTKLVPNPTVAVTPEDGQFSASWTADANATSYVAYLHTATTATPATGGTDITSSISHVGSAYSITDYAVANGTYYLYIKVNGVTSGYEVPTAYVEKSFTCEGTPKGSAVENPYTVAEAVAAYVANNSIGSKYVMGIVCEDGFTSNNKVCCYISADGTTTNKFELYNITAGATADDLKVGDAVIAHGTLTYYSNGSMYETSPTTVDAIIKKPVFTPNGSNFVTSQSVAIASTGSSSIHYTTDGSAPSVSAGSVYSSALDLGATTTVKAVGIDANAVVCTAVASATFTKVSTYAVTWSAPSHGSITVKQGESTISSNAQVPQGATINITVSPDDGYVLSTLVYNDGSDHDIKAAKSFTMPAHSVSITATFESGEPEPTAIYTANFEGASEHRTEGNNSYTSNTYTVGGVSWDLTYADIISNASLEGSYNCTMRSAKNTNNCPTFTTGNILSSSTTVTKITFQATFNATYHKSHTLEYSVNGGTSWNTLTDARDNTVNASNGYSATFTSVTTSDLRLRFTVTCTGHGSTNSTCDSRIDNIIVYGY